MNIESLKERLKNLSPMPLRKFVREGLKVYRNLRNKATYKVTGKALSEGDIIEALKRVGIEKGDSILVHSSMSRLGLVDGGAKTVVSALLNTVGPKGTIGAPTFWGNSSNYSAGNRIFDVNKSPSILGVISEKIRNQPNAKRSMHPTHSVAFVGPMSDFLVSDHHLDNTPVGVNSPYFKLTKINGKILLLGVTLEYLTSFHTIEDVAPNFPVNVYLDSPLIFTVIDQLGNVLEVSTYCHSPEVGNTRQCIKMEPYLKKNMVLKETKLGNASVKLLDAKLLHTILLRLLKKGITMYSPG